MKQKLSLRCPINSPVHAQATSCGPVFSQKNGAVSRGAGMHTQVGQPSYEESAPERPLVPAGHLDTNRADGTKENLSIKNIQNDVLSVKARYS